MIRGTADGLSALPYYQGDEKGLQELNRTFTDMGAQVTLEDTYRLAYGLNLDTVGVDGDERKMYFDMKLATIYLQKLLKSYNVLQAENYYMTAINTEMKHGFRLVAIVYRNPESYSDIYFPRKALDVIDKFDGFSEATYKETEFQYYIPYQIDIFGTPVDTVVYWAVVPIDCAATQKHQAVLLTQAANAVLNTDTSTDYWDVENRWISGGFIDVAREMQSEVCLTLGLGSEYRNRVIGLSATMHSE